MLQRQGAERVFGRTPRHLSRMFTVVNGWIRYPKIGRLVAWMLLSSGMACGHPLGTVNAQAQVSATAEWHASNGPLLAEYLKTLPENAIGQPLKGIRLSGDSESPRWLEGQVYRGVPSGLPEGLGVRLVDDGQGVLAFVWLENGASPYELQACESGEQKGIRARLAGGGAYAWMRVRPEHGVVYTACPPVEWLPTEGSSSPVAPPAPPPAEFRG
jgi:hypothetical protein